MKRADLTAILSGVEGIEDKHIKDILALVHSETDPLKDERDELQKQLDEAKKNSGTESDRYNKLKDEYEKYKSEQTAKESRASKEAHLEELLTTAKFSDEGKKIIKAIVRVDELEADKDGKIKGAADLISKLSNDWSGYVTKDDKGGSKTDPGQPGNNGGNTMTKEEIMKIKDAAKRQQAIADNHELFGF